MKFPYSMLLDFVKTDLTAHECGDLLTMAGFELEGIEEVNGEPVLDIKVMSNRGDGLSVFGLAREVLAKDANAKPNDLYIKAALRFDGLKNKAAPSNVEVPVDIQTENCTRYACRLFTDIKKAQSPAWMQDRLTKAGQRPISLIVDLTNYVMLELGQPLHAFDFDKLRGNKIVVRQAKPEEKIVTLDEQERELQPFMMMICDAERPVAVAGVMGGLATEVSSSTSRMLLESAHFVNTSVRKTHRALGLSTEASYRFERSVDPTGVVAAIDRFTQLFEECGGGSATTATTDVFPKPPIPRVIKLRLERSNLLLGMPITETEAVRYLTALDFGVKNVSPGVLEVTAPAARPDVVREEDVIEELGRIHGYDKIPATLPHGSTTRGGTRGFEAWEDNVRNHALRLGFTQTISHTLRDLDSLDNPDLERIGPRGINDPEMKWLRNSTLPSLSDAAKRNGGKDLHLFELGQIFGRKNGAIYERTSLGLLSQGAIDGTWWQGKTSQSATFYTLKGVVESLFGISLQGLSFKSPAKSDARLHPTRQAEIIASHGSIGVLGQIDPDVAEKAGLPSDTVLAEIDLNSAYVSAKPNVQVKPISRNPAVRRDLAFLIDKSVAFDKVHSEIERAAGDLLEQQWLFDVYEGKGVPEGKHSLAVALQLRKMGANLTDDEANQVRERIVAALAKLGATPR